MSAPSNAVAVAPGVWQVEIDGRRELVYVVHTAHERWAFCRGHVFVEPLDDAPASRSSKGPIAQTALTAPMPARVLKIVTSPGARVRSGDTLVIVEAMKMELPLRAVGNGVVAAIRCQEGQLVSPIDVLIEFQPETAT